MVEKTWVISAFHKAISTAIVRNTETTDVPVTALVGALELLKEQEAVKPIVEQYALPLTNTSVRFIKKHYCGICKEEITGNNVFCHKCGRKVKWG